MPPTSKCPKHTSLSLWIIHSCQLSNGYGGLVVSSNTKSSYGYFSRIDATLEQCFIRRIFLLLVILVLCLACRETRGHLFIHCPFAHVCWTYLCPSWKPSYQGVQADIDHIKELLGMPFSFEIIILASWEIWTTRNDFIFKGITPSLYTCRKKFKDELK